MATTEIANRFGRIIRRVSSEFSLATTDNEQAKQLIEEWPAIAIILEVENEFLSIRAEIAGSRVNSTQETWTNYVCLLDNILLRYVSALDKLCQQYLDDTPPGDWLIHGGDGVSDLENLASSISTAMQLLLHLAWFEIRDNPIPVACHIDIPRKSNSSKQTGHKTLEELFKDQRDIDLAVEALQSYRHRTEKPLIEGRKWVADKIHKGVIYDWWERLEDAGYIKEKIPAPQLVPLLNAFFTDLNLGVASRAAGNTRKGRKEWPTLILEKKKAK